MRTLLVLDPGCKSRSGHHYALNSLISKKAPDAGWQTRILTNIKLGDNEIGDPVFRRNIYDIEKSPEQLLYWSKAVSKAFCEDLIHHGSNNIDSSTYVLIHTCSYSLLAGLADWLLNLKSRKIRPFVRLHFFFPSTFWIRKRKIVEFSDKLFEQSIKYITGSEFNVGLSADTPSLADRLKEWSGRDVPVVLKPSSVPPGLIAQTPANRGGPLTFLYIGKLREEKGLMLLLAALEAMSRDPQPIKFRFVVPDMSDEIRTRFSIFKNIVSLRVEPDIDDESYFTEIKNANYVLCTYSPKTYRLRGSGLMMDALAIGTPVVCTAGVGALEHVDRENRDAIEIVQSYSAFSVLKGLRQATMKADFRQSIAKNASKVFRERMDPDHWFEMMTAA